MVAPKIAKGIIMKSESFLVTVWAVRISSSNLLIVVDKAAVPMATMESMRAMERPVP